MKEAIVSANQDKSGVSVEIIDSPIPSPGPDDVVVKVIVSGSNPKDWKLPIWTNQNHNSGDDIAGTVHTVGKNVTEFHPGDPPASNTFHIPAKTTYEEASTIPLAAMTAAVGLFVRLGLPEPWTFGREDGKAGQPTGPVLLYGAASAVGAFAVQLAKRANIGPIIAIAGRGIAFVQSLLGKEDSIVDYRKGDESVVRDIKDALKGQKLQYTFDAVSEKGSYVNASKAMDGGKITLVLPGRDYSEIPSSIEKSTTSVGDAYLKQTDFGHAWFRLFAKGLQEGWLKPHPTEVVKGGLEGVQEGLTNLQNGKNSGLKYVFRIEDTPGVK